MTGASEVLVVDPGGEWSDRFQVLATAPPRVSVFSAGPDGLDEMLALVPLAFVRRPDGATETHGDAGVVDELDAGARLFVEAWLQPRPSKSHRPGEGLPWDSPGFQPPDRPQQ